MVATNRARRRVTVEGTNRARADRADTAANRDTADRSRATADLNRATEPLEVHQQVDKTLTLRKLIVLMSEREVLTSRYYAQMGQQAPVA